MIKVKPSGARDLDESEWSKSKENVHSLWSFSFQTWSKPELPSSLVYITRSLHVWKAASHIRKCLPLGQQSNEVRFSECIISHIVTRFLVKTAIRLSSAENATFMLSLYSTSADPTSSQVVVSRNSTESSRRDFVATIFPEGENPMISGLSVTSWMTGWLLPTSSMFHILTVPSLLPTKSLWPSPNGQILVIPKVVKGSVLKIIFELLIKTSHISTVLSRETTRRLALGKWMMAGGIFSTSRLKDDISCVSSLQRHLWSDSLNAAIKQSLVSEKWSDEMSSRG